MSCSPSAPTPSARSRPDKKIVWKYEAKPKAGYKGRVEVHAFQPLPDGRRMVAETGNKRIVEVDRDGKIVKEVPLTVDKPDPHRDTRMVRKLDNGHYLVCHEGDGAVREYDDTGKVVWEYKLDLAGRPRSPGHGPEGHGTEVFGAIRLPNGNTLIAGGNNNRVLEVTPDGRDRLVDRPRRAARHPARLGDDAAPPAERQHHHRQLPRRPDQSATDRSDAGQESRLDVQGFHDLRQCAGGGRSCSICRRGRSARNHETHETHEKCRAKTFLLFPACVFGCFVVPSSAEPPAAFDVLIRGGTVYDGSGQPPRRADVGIRGDQIVAVGDLAERHREDDDRRHRPGRRARLHQHAQLVHRFAAGRRPSQSEIRQGVTTQIMGEGESWGPVNDAIKKRMKAEQTDIKYDIEWTHAGRIPVLPRAQGRVAKRGVVPRGDDGARIRPRPGQQEADGREMEQMRRLVEREMRDGALGIASALEYAPAYYADTAGADRAVQGRGQVQGQVHLAHAQRRASGCSKASTR